MTASSPSGDQFTELLQSVAGLLGRVSSGERTLEVASRAIEFVSRLTGADFGCLVVPELDYEYHIVDALGSTDPRTAGLRKKMSYSPVSRVLQGGQRIVLTDIQSLPPGEVDDWIQAEGLVDVVLEPLVTRMGTKGMLAVGFRRARAELREVPQSDSTMLISAIGAASAFLSLAIESQEIVDAARTQAYHAELLNVVLSKARRLGSSDEMLEECLASLARGLGLRAGIACTVVASHLELRGGEGRGDAAEGDRAGEGSLYQTVATVGEIESATPQAPPIAAWMDRAARDASRRLLELSRHGAGGQGLGMPTGAGLTMAPITSPGSGMVAIFARGKLGDGSPPAFWVGFVPSAGRPSFLVGMRPAKGTEFSSAEIRLLQRLAEEFSHYLSYAAAFAAEREAARRLADLDRTKSELLGVVSHELRTPLTSIKGFTTSLLEGLGKIPEEKQRRFLSIVDSQAERLAKLIDDFLDMSRLQEGALALELGRVDLCAVVARVAEHYAAQAREKGMQIAFDPEACRGAVVEADESKVEQIVTNLVSNSIKYGEGTISISVRPRDDGYAVVVEDEGPGVPEEKRSQIFDRFVQADSSSTRKASGVGLGLAIAKGLAEAHGGALWYEPIEPRGARFVLYLPLVGRTSTAPGIR